MTLVNGEQKTQFNFYHFGPADIPAIFAPTWAEHPNIPVVVEDNADTPRRGGIYPKLQRGRCGWREPQKDVDN